MNRRSALASIAAGGLYGALPIPQITLRQWREEDFERVLRLANVPSMSYAVVDGDRITARAIGVRRAGESDRATTDTVYAAASLTKAVFAYVFLGLVEEGLISLDRPVRDYVPLPNPDDPRAGTITARRLLSHSGGWRNWRITRRSSWSPSSSRDRVGGTRAKDSFSCSGSPKS